MFAAFALIAAPITGAVPLPEAAPAAARPRRHQPAAGAAKPADPPVKSPAVTPATAPVADPPSPTSQRQAMPAPIGYLTAGELADRCSDSAPSSTTYCFAFITGVHDTAQAYEKWLDQREFCPAKGVAQADLRRAFLTYLVAYPQNRGGEAASVVIVALKETYPC